MVALAALLAGWGCRVTPKPAGEKVVVATTSQVRDLVQNLLGPETKVIGLMGPGVDPHLYKPTAGDVRRLESADVIFYSGLELEGRMGDILEKASGTRDVVAVAEDIPDSQLIPLAAIPGHHDPHFWFDPELWSQAADHAADALIQIMPARREEIRANHDRYVAELRALDADIKQKVETIPKEKRVLVTAHDAFGYFGRRYGFEIHGIQGTSTVSEASAGDIQRLADLIAARRIRSIFVESSVPTATIDALQQAVKSRGWQVGIGGSLYSDAMGDAGTLEGTYLGMLRRNVDVIVESLR